MNKKIKLVSIAFSLSLAISIFTAAPKLEAKIYDLRIENGDELTWTAPSNAYSYKIQFYTGETNSEYATFGGCSYDLYQASNINGPKYCAGEEVSITTQQGHKEVLKLKRSPSNTYKVDYYNNRGSYLGTSNIAHHYKTLPPIQNIRLAGNELQWTAPSNTNIKRYLVAFYTGEARSNTDTFGGCSYDISQADNPRSTSYCAGTAVDITFSGGRTEKLNLSGGENNSFIVRYEDINGNTSSPSAFVYYSHRRINLPAIQDVRLVGNELQWTAPINDGNIKRYLVTFYTGEAMSSTDKFGGCSYDLYQESNPGDSRYCAGNAVDITFNGNHTEKLQLSDRENNSYIIKYEDISGNISTPSNFVSRNHTGGAAAIHNNNQTLPPAGYEDEVITNFESYKNPFPDTTKGSLLGKAAAELYRRAIIGGYPDGEFKGSKDVNRAEAAKFLLLAHYGTVANVTNNGQFKDVKNGQWYTKYVMTAANEGIINGYPDGSFRPANTINTAEFLKMITLTFKIKLNKSYNYKDVKTSNWFSKYAGTAKEYNLFPERNPNYLEPAKTLTRKEVAIAIYQYLLNR